MAYSGDELIGIGYGINLEVPLLIYHIIYSWGIFGVFHKKREWNNLAKYYNNTSLYQTNIQIFLVGSL